MTDRERSEFERLADWAEGRLSEDEARDARGAPGRGPTRPPAPRPSGCRAFSRASEDVVLDAPPARLREELSASFEAYAEGRRQPGPLRRLVATLSFEGGAAGGLRCPIGGRGR